MYPVSCEVLSWDRAVVTRDKVQNAIPSSIVRHPVPHLVQPPRLLPVCPVRDWLAAHMEHMAFFPSSPWRQWHDRDTRRPHGQTAQLPPGQGLGFLLLVQLSLCRAREQYYVIESACSRPTSSRICIGTRHTVCRICTCPALHMSCLVRGGRNCGETCPGPSLGLSGPPTRPPKFLTFLLGRGGIRGVLDALA